MLRRAVVQGARRGLDHGARRDDRARQHARGEPHRRRREPHAHAPLRGHAADAHVPRLVRRGALRVLRGTARARPRARGHRARSLGPRTPRRRDRRGAPARARRLLRAAVSVPQARPRGGARVRRRRHGEPGARDLSRRAHAARRADRPHLASARHVARDRARARAPVVRRPGHHALVERPVAQRGLRHVDGERARARHVAPRARRPLRRGRRISLGPQRRLPRERSRDARRRDFHQSGHRVLRRHHVLEGRGAPRDARSLGRSRTLPRRRARVPPRPRVGQRHGGRPPRRPHGRGGQRRGPRREQLPRSDGRSAHRRAGRVRRERARAAHAATVALLARARSRTTRRGGRSPCACATRREPPRGTAAWCSPTRR